MNLKLMSRARFVALILVLLLTQFVVPVSAAESIVRYQTYLRGANEVAGGDTDGRGRADVFIRFGRSQICYDLTLQDIALPLTGAHIHIGAAGVNGPIVVNFPVDGGANLADCVDVARDMVKMIAASPARFYVNVHNAEFPGGALRGQLRKK